MSQYLELLRYFFLFFFFFFFFFFLYSGMSVVFDAAGIIPGDKQRCVDILKEGHLLVIAPGNLFTHFRPNKFLHPYSIYWKNQIST